MSTTLDAATASHRASLSSSQAAALVGELIRHLLARDAEVAAPLVARLDEAVLSYEVEFRGYLNGQGKRPPVDLGAVLATAFDELAAGGRRSIYGFRIEGLEARFRAAERLLTQRLERSGRHLPPRETRTA